MKILLTQGKYAIVDDADFDFLSQWKWTYSIWRSKESAYRQLMVDGKITQVKMHRLIMDAPKGLVVDHIDGDSLNNQRSNLRVCTQRENAANRSASSSNTSGYKGVSLDKRNRSKVWVAEIKPGGKKHWLGNFLTAKEAAIAYNKAAVTYFGEFAKLNEIL